MQILEGWERHQESIFAMGNNLPLPLSQSPNKESVGGRLRRERLSEGPLPTSDGGDPFLLLQRWEEVGILFLYFKSVDRVGLGHGGIDMEMDVGTLAPSEVTDLEAPFQCCRQLQAWWRRARRQSCLGGWPRRWPTGATHVVPPGRSRPVVRVCSPSCVELLVASMARRELRYASLAMVGGDVPWI